MASDRPVPTDPVRVPSRHRDDRAWEVVRAGGALVCECPAYSFSRARPKRCHHTDTVGFADAAIARCAAKGHAPLCRKCLVALLGAIARKIGRTARKGKR